MQNHKITYALLGLAIGDAVGVPFEFKGRAEMSQYPATDMIGYGTHNQKPGTWSDDSSLTFCLAESLIAGYDLADISAKFIAWRDANYWTAREEVFDIGITTSKAISRLKDYLNTGKVNELKYLIYDGDEYENGNGSLMRILPLLAYIKGKEIKEQFTYICQVSALTHRHIRAAMCCLIYLRLAEYLYDGHEKGEAYTKVRQEIQAFWEVYEFPEEERRHFSKVIQSDIRHTDIDDIKTGGYVMESLESACWFLLQKETYEDTILAIINLGHDTDTSAAIVGGLAALYYGIEQIPEYWLISLAKMEDIIDLGERLHAASPALHS